MILFRLFCNRSGKSGKGNLYLAIVYHDDTPKLVKQ